MKYFLCLLCFISLTTSCTKKAGTGAFGGKAYTAQELGTRTFYPTLQEAGPCTPIEEGRLILIGAAGGTRLPHECKAQEWVPVTTVGPGVTTREIGAQGDKGEAGKDGIPDTETAENRRLSEIALAGSEQAKREAEQAKRDSERAAGEASIRAGSAHRDATAATTAAGTATIAATAANTALATTQLLATAPPMVETEKLVPAGDSIYFDLADPVTAPTGSPTEKFRLAAEAIHGTHMVKHKEGFVYDTRYMSRAAAIPIHFIPVANFPDIFLQNHELLKGATGSVQVLQKGKYYFLLYRNHRAELILSQTNLFFGEKIDTTVCRHADDTYRLIEKDNDIYAVGIEDATTINILKMDTTSPVQTRTSLQLKFISNADPQTSAPKILDISAVDSPASGGTVLLGLLRLGEQARLINLSHPAKRTRHQHVREGVPWEKYKNFDRSGNGNSRILDKGVCLGPAYMDAAGNPKLSAYFVRKKIGSRFLGLGGPDHLSVLQEMPISFDASGTVAITVNSKGGAREFHPTGSQMLEGITHLQCVKDNRGMLLNVNTNSKAYLVETDFAGRHHLSPKWKPTIALQPPSFIHSVPLSAGRVIFTPTRPSSPFPIRDGYLFFQTERDHFFFKEQSTWASSMTAGLISDEEFTNINIQNPKATDASQIKIVSMPQGDATKEYPFVNMIWTHSNGSIYLRRIQLDDQLAASHTALQVNQVPGTWQWNIHNPYPFPLRMKITLTR